MKYKALGLGGGGYLKAGQLLIFGPKSFIGFCGHVSSAGIAIGSQAGEQDFAVQTSHIFF